MKNAIFASLCVSVLAACSSNGEIAGPIDAEAGADDPQEASLEPGGKTVMDLNRQIAYSVQDLANRLGTDAESITVIAAREVNWSSGALGCPGKDMGYIQALVPGVLLILNAGNQNYGYHAKRGGRPFYCPRDRARPPANMQKEDIA